MKEIRHQQRTQISEIRLEFILVELENFRYLGSMRNRTNQKKGRTKNLSWT